MIIVVFEVELRPEGRDDYFALAADLREELKEIDGFISIERFQSLNDPGKILSLSTWRDEAAVEAWYSHRGHAMAQREGRARIFRDYRIRVASVLRDYDMASGRMASAALLAEDGSPRAGGI